MSRPLLPAPYIGVVLACGRAQRRQQAERIIPASCVQQWAARVLDHLNTITAEPTPVTCEHCHGEGCEDCRNHGVRPELIDERDILGGDA